MEKGKCLQVTTKTQECELSLVGALSITLWTPGHDFDLSATAYIDLSTVEGIPQPSMRFWALDLMGRRFEPLWSQMLLALFLLDEEAVVAFFASAS